MCSQFQWLAVVFIALLRATSPAYAQAGVPESDEQWVRARLGDAVTSVASWNVGAPSLTFTESDHVEVDDRGEIQFGRGLASRLRKAPNSIRLTNFLLLHELRHIQQIALRTEKERRFLECDADFNALLQIGRRTIGAATSEAAVRPTLAELMGLQGLGASVAELVANGATHNHLLPRERFVIGAYAIWRAIYEWSSVGTLASSDEYASLRYRANTFVQPNARAVDEWVSLFCDSVSRSPGPDAGSLESIIASSTILTDEGPEDVLVFSYTYMLTNHLDRPVRVIGWPLNGLRGVGGSTLYSSYVATSGGHYELLVPAKGKAKVTVNNLSSPFDPKGMESFSWDSFPMSAESIGLVVAEGARVEPPNCGKNWKEPNSSQVAQFMAFLLRAGALAARRFEGLIGDERNTRISSGVGIPRTFDWLGLPPDASPADSFISNGGFGLGPYGRVELRATAQSDVGAAFLAHKKALEHGCGADVAISERQQEGGGRMLTVSRLTIGSRATLYLTRVEPKKGVAEEKYSMYWIITAIE